MERTSLGTHMGCNGRFSTAQTRAMRVPPVLSRLNQSAATFGMSIPS